MTDRPLTVNGVRLTPETIIKTREHFAEIDRRCFADDLRLGEIVIPCAVLQDGTRVLSERGISKALGRTRSKSHWQKKREQGAELPLYLTAGNIKPFISNELIMAPSEPRRYRSPHGGRAVAGVPATVLPDICASATRKRSCVTAALSPSQTTATSAARLA